MYFLIWFSKRKGLKLLKWTNFKRGYKSSFSTKNILENELSQSCIQNCKSSTIHFHSKFPNDEKILNLNSMGEIKLSVEITISGFILQSCNIKTVDLYSPTNILIWLRWTVGLCSPMNMLIWLRWIIDLCSSTNILLWLRWWCCKVLWVISI